MPVKTDTKGKLIGVVDLSQRPEIIQDDRRFFIGLFPDELPWVGPFKTSTDAIRWLRQMFGDEQMKQWELQTQTQEGGA